ncbi:MAG: RNA polymerase sigma factor [Actinobacteria bacterium]|nr:MAG: RNA polymerase sigma factor [Actinomycetota bacterium]
MEAFAPQVLGIIKKVNRAKKDKLRPAEQSDELLAANYLDGDDEALKILIERHLRLVYNFIYQLTKDTASLDDLTQETFIKVWRNLASFDQDKSFKAWIFTIAKNTTYDFLKKKKSVPFSALQDDEEAKLEAVVDKELLPQELVEGQELADEFEKKINELPIHYRIILLLHYKYDFSLSEIASVMEEPYNTIKSRHQRALKAVSGKL